MYVFLRFHEVDFLGLARTERGVGVREGGLFLVRRQDEGLVGGAPVPGLFQTGQEVRRLRPWRDDTFGFHRPLR